jgi:hypothetical protein
MFKPGDRVRIIGLTDACFMFKIDEIATVSLAGDKGPRYYGVGKTKDSKQHGKDYWNFLKEHLVPAPKPIIILDTK